MNIQARTQENITKKVVIANNVKILLQTFLIFWYTAVYYMHLSV